MTIIFHDLLHKILEDYIDDLLGKSKTRDEHIPILRKIFERLEKYKMCLNPTKCVFGVTSGKLLGFIVSHRGIEVDPIKLKAIMEMPPLKTLKKFAASKEISNLLDASFENSQINVTHLCTYYAKIPNSNGATCVRRILRNSKNTLHHLPYLCFLFQENHSFCIYQQLQWHWGHYWHKQMVREKSMP